MKILHTSDWHLGQYFMMRTREAEHVGFLSWLVDIVTREKIDAVIVAGDIFDSSTPPSYARKLYSDFIVNLQATTCQQLIIVSGNHDSVAVLNESKSLLKALNVSVLAGLSDDLSEHLITLKDAQQQDAVIVCALPFLRANDVMTNEFGLSVEKKQQNLQRGIEDTYQKMYQLAQKKCAHKKCAIIATGHLTAIGCSVSESERDIYIGTLGAFPSSLFPDFDYIALGHLHRAQKVQKSEYIRYCGSPIPLSFDESKNNKQVIIAEFADKPTPALTSLTVPNFQELRVISGDLESVCEQLKDLMLTDKQKSIWIEIKLKQASYISDVHAQLNTLLEDSSIEILKITTPQIMDNSQLQETQTITLDALTPIELFQHRLQCEDSLSAEQQNDLSALFAQVCAELEEQA